MFHNIGALHNPALVEADEHAARIPWYRTRCCQVFSVSLTFTGFLTSIAAAFYFLIIQSPEYIPCIIAAVFCLMVFVHLVSGDAPNVTISRPMSAIPVQITSGDRYREIVRRTQSERGSSLVPERADLFHSLPAYILVPAEPQDRDESSNASTESTLSAESTKRHEEETELLSAPQNREVLKQPATSGSSATKLSEAAVVISQIVKDTIMDNVSTAETTTVEQSSDSSSEKVSEAKKEGVRQRKPTPMEAQEYIPLAEDLKKG